IRDATVTGVQTCALPISFTFTITGRFPSFNLFRALVVVSFARNGRSQAKSFPRKTSELLGSRFFSRMSLLGGQRRRREPQGRMAPLEGPQVKRFVVGGTGFPAAIENANPLVGQGANGGMVRNAVLPLLLVISRRPERLFSGRIREFVKGLAQELGTGPAPVHPAHLAARRSDGSDARELLNLFGALIAVAVSAERGGQARAQGFSGAGQAVKELL